MTYNILAEHLAHEHAPELYRSSPRYALEWGYRSKLIVREVSCSVAAGCFAMLWGAWLAVWQRYLLGAGWLAL